MPTLEQRKAVFRTIFDIAIHNKRELSNNHKYCLIRWGQSFLHLSIIPKIRKQSQWQSQLQ